MDKPENMPKPKRITRLKASNFGGLQEMDIKLGKHTLLTGAKGAGKTSVLEMIRGILTGKGLRPYLVEIGKDKAVLLLELDDGTTVTTVKRTLKPPSKTASLSVEKDGMKPAKPQSYIDALLGAHASNPVDFFNLSAKEQEAELLALTDISMTENEYAELSDGAMLQDVDYTQHPLVVLADIAKALFDERTVVNRDGKQKRGAAAEALESIPDDFDAEAVREATLGDLVDKQTAARQQNKDVEETRNELESLRKQIELAKQEREVLEEQEIIQSKWLEENAEIDTAALDQQIHDFQERQDLLRIYDGAKTTEDAVTQLSSTSEQLTNLIEAARDKPGELLAALDDLPVEGMGVDAEYGVTINGVPIASLSDGESLDLAMEIALRYAGELPLLLVNGLEALDPESEAQLREKLIASDCQCIVTKVSKGELVIEEWAERDIEIPEEGEDDGDEDAIPEAT